MVAIRLAVPGKLRPPQRPEGNADFAPAEIKLTANTLKI